MFGSKALTKGYEMLLVEGPGPDFRERTGKHIQFPVPTRSLRIYKHVRRCWALIFLQLFVLVEAKAHDSFHNIHLVLLGSFEI
jgi:hypothetical protein